ncbi:hypothetical protein [Paenibacillus sp. J5C2022]|uniref:hypothetical protein n=1 Tax=Paenibacillus sp. J5C2022 TaxID=2977129 RepID=UPI0021D18ACA|nr:hypothetical protein [Paenibacillus sp. J5C2022]
MPDWSYQTLFRPLLFRLPARASRAFTLGAIGAISRIPGGSFVIRTLGHMELSPLLERNIGGVDVVAPVGVSGGVDPGGIAHRALAQFGIGWIEHGPITTVPIKSDEPIGNDSLSERIRYPSYFENDGVEAIANRIQQPGHRLPQFVRIAPMPNAPPEDALEQLGKLLAKFEASGAAAGCYIDIASSDRSWHDVLAIYQQLQGLVEQLAITMPLYLYLPLDLPNGRMLELLGRSGGKLWDGIVIGEYSRTGEERCSDEDGSGKSLEGQAESSDLYGQETAWTPSVKRTQATADYAVEVGRNGLTLAVDKVKLIRETFGPDIAVKAGAGVHQPSDALRLLKAGANGIMLHSGLVYAGPGLPKRINEAVIYEKVSRSDEPKPPSFWRNWGWMCLLGIGMIIGGLIAWQIGATNVLLPYDTAFLGMTAADVVGANRYLLYFMSHDRITLAGTMLSIGILYYGLARYGLRAGQHWARTALITSASVGFASFFLYLGYGYFDPLHALAAAVLLPLFLLSLRGHKDLPSWKPVNLHNDRTWRMAMWGQLCFVILGFALAAGGAIIAGVGITHVFVKTDLAYLCTTPEALNAINPKLMSLIAHDRAGFGGALLCDALAILIIALWGITQGARWLWWTLLLGGAPGFYAGFSVHIRIGYTDFIHLLPAYFALILFIAGLILLYPYMMGNTDSKSRDLS